MTDKEPPNIVREFIVGHTQIKIADDFCREKSHEDVTKALREIARTAQAYLSVAAVKAGKNSEENKKGSSHG